MTHRFQACTPVALMLLLQHPLKHRRKFACKIIKLIYLQNNYLFCENMLGRHKMSTCPSESIPLPVCHAILLLSSNTNYVRTTGQLTI